MKTKHLSLSLFQHEQEVSSDSDEEEIESMYLQGPMQWLQRQKAAGYSARDVLTKLRVELVCTFPCDLPRLLTLSHDICPSTCPLRGACSCLLSCLRSSHEYPGLRSPYPKNICTVS